VALKSVWLQGVLSGYRGAYWYFWVQLLLRWGLNPQKRRLGFELALSGHHFISYARQVAETLESCPAMPPRRSKSAPQTSREPASLMGIDWPAA
jgi:hypothetical protein